MEIPLTVKHANKEFDWNSIKETHNFNIRKIKRRRLNGGNDLEWKDDPGERASKIWEWWKLRTTNNDDFKYSDML